MYQGVIYYYIQFILYLLGTYKLHSGCIQGTACRNGTICGKPRSGCSGSECSFTVCNTQAEYTNSVAFAYRGTGLKSCRLCKSSSELQNIRSTDNWGVYTKNGNL